MRFQELYERCGKAIGIGIILSKEEGGILILKPATGDKPSISARTRRGIEGSLT